MQERNGKGKHVNGIHAGAVIWRFSNKKLQILLVHQTNKSKTLWSIPKGGVKSAENTEKAARRELQEETNVAVNNLDFLGYVDYGKTYPKRIYCYMGACPELFEIKWKTPEIDRAGFFDVGMAKKMVDKRQRGLILALQKILAFA